MTPIAQLDDDSAVRLLTTIARSRVSFMRTNHGASDTDQDTPEFRAALARHFAIASPGAKVSPGELARQGLTLLAEDHDTRQAMEAMAAAPPSAAHTFDGGAGLALTAAVIFVLKTQLEMSYDKSRGFTFKLKSKALSDSALKPLVEKLISYLP